MDSIRIAKIADWLIACEVWPAAQTVQNAKFVRIPRITRIATNAKEKIAGTRRYQNSEETRTINRCALNANPLQDKSLTIIALVAGDYRSMNGLKRRGVVGNISAEMVNAIEHWRRQQWREQLRTDRLLSCPVSHAGISKWKPIITWDMSVNTGSW